MKTNILVQYQGGGYSGCFWEWNYFYIDRQGMFHDIFSSGKAGITTQKQADKEIANPNKDTYFYDMSKEKDISKFTKECNSVHITGVSQWFEDNPDYGVKFFALCSECKNKIYSCEEIILENWHGCGGIESTADLLLCQECYFAGYCNCCESYVGETKLVRVEPDEHHGFECVCNDCKEYHDEERENQQREDLRFESFITGNPDMFSDDMRWLWSC